MNNYLLLGSGPSLWAATHEDVTIIRANLDRITVMAVGNSISKFPWAHILYASNADWWDAKDGVLWFSGERVTQSLGEGQAQAGDRWGLRVIPAKNGSGLTLPPSEFIHLGGHGGFQAINLAILRGGRGIGLLGFDYRPLTPVLDKARQAVDDCVKVARGIGATVTDLGTGGLLARSERGSLGSWLGLDSRQARD